MKKINSIIITLAILGMTGGVLTVSDVMAERSWDNKAEKENVVWKQELESWNQTIAKWSEKRDSLHEQYYGDRYSRDIEYCDTVGCWEEDMFGLIFTSKSGLVQEMDKHRGDVGSDFTFKDGSTWDCANGGQVLTFNNLEGEFWDSSNHGQVIEYKNTKGDYWESSNTGQVIKFEGADGTKWESSNYGQVVEYTDKDGKQWSGSDSDNAEDMMWRK
jgi:hypothetical protein